MDTEKRPYEFKCPLSRDQKLEQKYERLTELESVFVNPKQPNGTLKSHTLFSISNQFCQ